MGKYIKLFDTHKEYEEWIEGSGFTMPSVSYCQDNPEEVHYDPWVRDYSKEYFTIEIVSAGDIKFQKSGNQPKTISYSTDGGNTWNDKTSSDVSSSASIGTFNVGDKILFKGTNSNYGNVSSRYSYFGGTAQYKVYGNIMSLIYGDYFIGKTTFKSGSSYVFYDLFRYSKVTEASNLILPVTNLVEYCYSYMFEGCSYLIDAPKLPATTLSINCYDHMFYECSSLVSAPELPSLNMLSYCYSYMFYGCKALTKAPILPATSLSSATGCYTYMFRGCTNLNYIKAMFTTTPGSYTSNWVNGVASTGTFVKNASATWQKTGASGIPTGWTVETASA